MGCGRMSGARPTHCWNLDADWCLGFNGFACDNRFHWNKGLIFEIFTLFYSVTIACLFHTPECFSLQRKNDFQDDASWSIEYRGLFVQVISHAMLDQ